MIFTDKIDRNLIIKNKKNVFKHVVRELYLRNGILININYNKIIFLKEMFIIEMWNCYIFNLFH